MSTKYLIYRSNEITVYGPHRQDHCDYSCKSALLLAIEQLKIELEVEFPETKESR